MVGESRFDRSLNYDNNSYHLNWDECESFKPGTGTETYKSNGNQNPNQNII